MNASRARYPQIESADKGDCACLVLLISFISVLFSLGDKPIGGGVINCRSVIKRYISRNMKNSANVGSMLETIYDVEPTLKQP